RRADPAPPRRQGLANPAAAQANDAAHHPQHHRGGATRRPHRGDDVSARQGEKDGGDQAAAAPQPRNRVERGIRAPPGTNLEVPARRTKPRVGVRGEQEVARRREAMTAAAALAKNRYFPTALGLGSFVAFIALVELLIRLGMINRFIVPMPSDIIAAFPRVIVEEHVLQRFLLTAGEAFSASILVTIFGVAGWGPCFRSHFLRL